MIHRFSSSGITVAMERVAGLNIRGFSPMKFSRKYFRGALATSVHYLPIAKSSWENFYGKHKTAKTRKFSPANLSPFTVLATAIDSIYPVPPEVQSIALAFEPSVEHAKCFLTFKY